MDKLEWSDGVYNCYSLDLGIVTVHVDWVEGGYRIHYGRYSVKQRFQHIEKAKKIAMQQISKHLVKAVADLSALMDE